MPLLDPRFIESNLKEFGNPIKVKIKIKEEFSKWGDAKVSFTEKTTKAVLNVLAESDKEVLEGISKSGDLVFFFSPKDKDIVERGNIIEYKNQTYEIYDVVHFAINDVVYLVQARTRKA